MKFPRAKIGRMRVAAALAAALLFASAAQAQSRVPPELANYPAKAVRFVVPSSPGGGADVLFKAMTGLDQCNSR